mmetsp:Transcript_8994/g.15619  ORF Transcript_8994/g.15619 Transcript_8994/m.15619 type:complete len:210 (-) Transcript_8994:1143-1772(-)
MGLGCEALYASVNREMMSSLPACLSSASRGSRPMSGANSPPFCLSKCCVRRVLVVVPMRPCLPMPAAMPGSGICFCARRSLSRSLRFLLRPRPMGWSYAMRASISGVMSKGEGLRGARRAPDMTPLVLCFGSYSARQLPDLRFPTPTKIWLSRWCHASAVTLPGVPILRTTSSLCLSITTTAPASSDVPELMPVRINCSSGLKMALVVA